MERNIKFITGNKNKFKEAIKFLSELEQFDVDLPEIQEIDAHKIIEAKLLSAREMFGGEFIVEDTSLHIDCLGGLPGPLIKWFEKSLGNDGIWELVSKYDNHSARAKVTIGHIDRSKNITFFEGAMDGTIVSPRGNNDFGWSPIFVPNGQNKTYAQMTSEEKNKISMRKLLLEN